MRRILGRGLAVLLSVAAVSAPAQPETMRPETVGEGTPEAAAPRGVIPVPVSDVRREGTFRPGEPFTYAVRAPHGDVPAAELAACLDGLGWRQAGKGRPDLEIGIDPAARGIVSEEAYRLEIAPRGIAVSARTAAGAFYAVQTLLQLMDDGRAEEIACRTIEDAPRFAYRGFMIDVSRHFRSVEFVKRQIDAMALFKLNRLHMHLTDGAGWRIEIDRYPRLTEFAAWRPYEDWQSWWEGDRSYCEADDPRARGGFYTKKEIREIVEYARLRHIEVIPEIEMPGHSEEVTAAYPELGCHGEPYRDGDLCPGNERTFEFLENVLLEVMELFPSEYIHIGGDEAGKSAWRDCAKCRERMRSEGLKDVDELQSYLIHRIERFLNAHGRRLLGWDEILDGGLAPGATVMSWRGTEGGLKAIRAGQQAVFVPGEFCYLDYTQDAPFTQPLSIGGYTPLRKVYSFEPVPAEMTPDEERLLLGVQANLWTERIATPEYAEYMLYPRLLIVAEKGWCAPERVSEESLMPRLLRYCERLDAEGINYRIPSLRNYHEFCVFTDSVRTTAECPLPTAILRYTLDGSVPTAASQRYTGPMTFRDDATLRLRAFHADGRTGDWVTIRYEKCGFARPAEPRETQPGLLAEWYFKRFPDCAAIGGAQADGRCVADSVHFPQEATGRRAVGIVFRGYIDVPEKGIHTFALASNDGSVLRIGDRVVIDNDGEHPLLEKTGQAALSAGLHPLELRFFDYNGGKVQLSLVSEDGGRRTLDGKWLRHVPAESR
mgnify:CR=1 FL=1